METLGAVLSVGLTGLAAWYFWPRSGNVEVRLPATGQTTESIVANADSGGILTEVQALKMAQQVTSKYFPQVDPRMVLAMAKIESSLNPKAYRYEEHLDDASIGLMQTLLQTATWLFEDMGATETGKPSRESLELPQVSIYFGAAYINWLRRYKGIARTEEWIVRAYNGGPAWEKGAKSRSMTLNHWNKYRKARYGA